MKSAVGASSRATSGGERRCEREDRLGWDSAHRGLHFNGRDPASGRDCLRSTPYLRRLRDLRIAKFRARFGMAVSHALKVLRDSHGSNCGDEVPEAAHGATVGCEWRESRGSKGAERSPCQSAVFIVACAGSRREPTVAPSTFSRSTVRGSAKDPPARLAKHRRACPHPRSAVTAPPSRTLTKGGVPLSFVSASPDGHLRFAASNRLAPWTCVPPFGPGQSGRRPLSAGILTSCPTAKQGAAEIPAPVP